MTIPYLIKIALSTWAFVLSPTFTLCWFPMFFISKFFVKYYTFLDDKLYSIYQRGVVFIYEHLQGSKVIFYGDYAKAFSKKENVLYISNHQSTVDWVLSDIIIARQGGIGRLRYVLKEELKYIPLYGAYFYNHGCIYVNRTKFEKQKAVRSLQYLRDNKISSWLVIFPEGTRYIERKKRVIEKSQEFAISQGLKPLKYHLTPRTKGVELVLEHLGDTLDAFYNFTILFEDLDNYEAKLPWQRAMPGMFDWFKKRRVMHINLERIPLSAVPRRGDELRNWLHGIFLKKDAMMSTILEQQIASTDKAWPMLQPRQITLSLWETLPSYMLLGGLTLYLWSRAWGRLLYVATMLGYGLASIVYAGLAI